ncbi:hypothetical protein H1R20_g14375, partial [Candolleomyces eurysporus]
MPIPTAPALLVGLGARLLVNTLNRAPGAETSTAESILVGVWQGIGLQYAGKHNQIVVFVGAAIAAKLFWDFATNPDANKSISTLIGVLLGAVGTELLSSLIDQLFGEGEAQVVGHRRRTRTLSATTLPYGYPYPSTPKPRSERVVQFRPSVQGGSVESDIFQGPIPSDITSLDSSAFDLIGHKPTATPMEREIAALRARASLADSERRRYKEERKWALSQGNVARAEQMKSEYKRYKALMESCHREADLKLLAMEASKERESRNDTGPFDFPKEPTPRTRTPQAHRPTANGHSSHSTPARTPQTHRPTANGHSSHTTPARTPQAARLTANGHLSHTTPSYSEYKAARKRRVSSNKGTTR